MLAIEAPLQFTPSEAEVLHNYGFSQNTEWNAAWLSESGCCISSCDFSSQQGGTHVDAGPASVHVALPIMNSSFLHQDCEKKKNAATFKGVSWVGTTIPEEVPCMSYSSNCRDVKTGQNNVWA